MRKILVPMTVALAMLVAITIAKAAAKPGDTAPAFSLQDTSGKTVNLSDYSGKIIVLEWVNPDCPFVQRHYNLKTMTTLADKYKDKDVIWLGIATGGTADADKLKSFAEKDSISHPILLDPDGAVGHAYGAKTTPHMFIIDKDGKLAYAGGIDNEAIGDPKAPLKEGTVNYVDKALTELQSGTTVSTPETKSYGCSVKYRK